MFYQSIHIGTSDYFKKEYGTNFNFAPHMHPCFEFITVMSGQMSAMVDGVTYTLNKGDGILIFPNQIHSLSSECSEHMLCIFSPKLVAAYWSKASRFKPISNLFRPEEYLINKLDDFGDNTKTIAKKGLLYLLCNCFNEVAEYSDSETNNKNLLQQIFVFLDQNFSGDCTLADLSKEIGYDYAYLSRYFKKSVGISYNQYLNIYRLNNACYLLNNTDETILNCAYESGFTSLRSFNRNFKEHFGVSPTQYIKSSRG